MKGSGTIRVLKRAGTTEGFCAERFRSCLWRVMQPFGGRFQQADALADAVVLYLRRAGCRIVTTRALLEMALRVLRKTDHGPAADALAARHRWRRAARRRLLVAHENGRQCPWERHWVTQQIQRRWAVTRSAALAISADIEHELLAGESPVRRQTVLDLIDERVENYGLAPWCLLASAKAG